MEKAANRKWVLGFGAVAVAAVVAVLLWGTTPTAPAVAPAPEATPPPPIASAPAPTPRAAPAPAPAVEPAVLPDPGAQGWQPPVFNNPEDARYPVDLEALRQKMPDNLYWKSGIPTHDPEVAKQRAAEAEHWNDLFGKVQSGTASEQEIQQYFDYKRQLSQDYMTFAKQVLTDYGDKLPDRDLGLYELAFKMHRTRLSEIPRQIEEALARKREQDQRRQEWVRGQQP